MAIAVADHGIGNPLNVVGITGTGFGTGTFTATASADTTISDSAIQTNSQIVLFPTNGPAGELLRLKSCYITTIAAGSAEFTVSASGAGSPGGDETFAYLVSTES